METKKEENLKMKNWVMVRPRKAKEWIIGILMVASILPYLSPILNLWNKPILVLGMPIFLLMALLSLVLVFIVINLALKWRVY